MDKKDAQIKIAARKAVQEFLLRIAQAALRADVLKLMNHSLELNLVHVANELRKRG